MERLMAFFKMADKCLLNFLKFIGIACFTLLTILITGQVIVRFFPIMSLHWLDEITELLYAYLIFYGVAALFYSNNLIKIDWLLTKIKDPKKVYIYKLLLEAMALLFIVVYLYESLRLTILARDVTNALAFPRRISYSCMPIGALFLVVYSIRNIVNIVVSHRKASYE